MPYRHCAILLTLAIAGCQAYEPMMVDLEAHDGAWTNRSPSGIAVSAFAKELTLLNAEAATPFDPADGFSLAEAEVVALMFNPRLRTARLRARVPLVGAGEAGRWDDPSFDFDVLRILESVDKPWLLGGAISFSIPISGRLALETEKAFADADVELYRAWLEEARVVAELREAWANYWINSRRVEQTQAYLAQLDTIIPIAQRQRQLGKIGSTAERVFQIERASRASELASIQNEGAGLALSIRALLGLKPSAPLKLESGSSIGASKAAGSVSPEKHPRLLLAKSEYEASERDFNLEIRKQYPDLNIGPAYEYEDGVGKAGLALSLPIPILNANRRAIAEARAARDASKAALEGEYEAVVGEVAAARAAVAAANARRQALEADVAPLVDRQLEDLRKQADLGEFDALIYLDALTRSFETKLQVLDAHLEEAAATNTLRSLIEPVTKTKMLNDLSPKGVRP